LSSSSITNSTRPTPSIQGSGRRAKNGSDSPWGPVDMHPGLDRILHFPLKQCAAWNGDGSSHAAKHQILRLSSPDASLEVCIFALKIRPEKTHQILIFISQLPHERCRHSFQLTDVKMLSADVHTYLLLRS
jgi:hypothetical protein